MMRVSYKNTAETLRKLGKNGKVLALGAALGTTVGVVTALQASVYATDLDVAPPRHPWSFSGLFDGFDHASLRRGWQVYKQVCSACHSLDRIRYRDMVNVFLTEAEAKAEAQEAMITDGPGDDGNMFQRPGRLSDSVPPPYPNQKAAMAANNGAYPPDLSLIAEARVDGPNYIFAILTGYTDPPAGMEVQEDLHYNMYFSGSWINMAQALYNEIIEYEDGTPATTSQLAKDVVTFLKWCGEPEMEKRKLFLLKALPVVAIGFMSAVYFKRHKNTMLRSRIVQSLHEKK